MLQLEFLLIFIELVHMSRKLNKSHTFASCKIQYVTAWMFTHLIGYFVSENYLCKTKKARIGLFLSVLQHAVHIKVIPAELYHSC